MTLPQRKIGHEYTWNRDPGYIVALGKLTKIHMVGETRVLTFADDSTVIDDVRVTEVKRGLFGGGK